MPTLDTLIAAKQQAHDRSNRDKQIIGVWYSGPVVYVRPYNSLARGLPDPLPKGAILYGLADRDYWKGDV
jgi:hypothetical protein